MPGTGLSTFSQHEYHSTRSNVVHKGRNGPTGYKSLNNSGPNLKKNVFRKISKRLQVQDEREWFRTDFRRAHPPSFPGELLPQRSKAGPRSSLDRHCNVPDKKEGTRGGMWDVSQNTLGSRFQRRLPLTRSRSRRHSWNIASYLIPLCLIKWPLWRWIRFLQSSPLCCGPLIHPLPMF